MTTQISNLWHAFNTPYQQTDEGNLYDLSEGASYSFTTDAKNWATSFAITFLFISKILPYIGLANPFPLTLLEGATILTTSTAACALTKRLIGFVHDKEKDQVVQNPFIDYIAFGTYFAVILYAIPHISQISYERMATLAMKTIWTPVIVSLYGESNKSTVKEDQVRKIQAIAKDYTKHHENVLKLSTEKQKQIYGSMFAQGLETPKEVVQDKPATLKGLELHKAIFHRIDPEEHETEVWIREKISSFIQTFGFNPLQTIEEQNEKTVDASLKLLDVNHLQWIILSLATAKDPNLKSDDFTKLKKRANQITAADPTGLVRKLKEASSLKNLQELVK